MRMWQCKLYNLNCKLESADKTRQEDRLGSLAPLSSMCIGHMTNAYVSHDSNTWGGNAPSRFINGDKLRQHETLG